MTLRATNREWKVLWMVVGMKALAQASRSFGLAENKRQYLKFLLILNFCRPVLSSITRSHRMKLRSMALVGLGSLFLCCHSIPTGQLVAFQGTTYFGVVEEMGSELVPPWLVRGSSPIDAIQEEEPLLSDIRLVQRREGPGPELKGVKGLKLGHFFVKKRAFLFHFFGIFNFY
jgi:hypothetical protein